MSIESYNEENKIKGDIDLFNELWNVVHKHRNQLNAADCLFIGERLLDIQKKINKLRDNY